MKKLFTKFVRICPKSGEFKGFRKTEGMWKIIFPVIGFAAFLWVVYRVATKPSRINYPCVKAAMPFAGGFITYVAVIAVSVAAIFKARKELFRKPAFFASAFLFAGLSGALIVSSNSEMTISNAVVEANQPMGTAQGIFPGRVVWAHNPDATNENCDVREYGNSWFNAGNFDQTVVDNMLSDVLQTLTGEVTDSASWKAVFEYHNNNVRNKGIIGYTPGEKIFIKINAVSNWAGNFSTKDLSVADNNNFGITETSPAIVMAVLRQLINVVGVPQSDIYVGDPLRHIYKHNYEYWHPEFPDVHYLDHNSTYGSLGREGVTKNNPAKIYYSDNGTILREGVWYSNNTQNNKVVHNDNLYDIYNDAEYMINLPMLKGHRRAGMTMFAKNHFGSHTREDASHLHNGLVAPAEMQNGIVNAGYGLYRIQTDIMAHSLLGKKNLIYIMDALWATDYEADIPRKWQIAPFNDDWMSSIFASLDPVAIESVGYDFLRSEFTEERVAGNSEMGAFVQMSGVDDYLHQAADSANWADGIVYDPDSTGVLFSTLGTHEHWNNAVDKQYSRNLGTGEGIELVSTNIYVSAENLQKENYGFSLAQNYPNPFNPSTQINYTMPVRSDVVLKIFDVTGKEIKSVNLGTQSAGTHSVSWNGIDKNGSPASSGVYFYTIRIKSLETSDEFIKTSKMLLLK